MDKNGEMAQKIRGSFIDIALQYRGEYVKNIWNRSVF